MCVSVGVCMCVCEKRVCMQEPLKTKVMSVVVEEQCKVKKKISRSTVPKLFCLSED